MGAVSRTEIECPDCNGRGEHVVHHEDADSTYEPCEVCGGSGVAAGCDGCELCDSDLREEECE